MVNKRGRPRHTWVKIHVDGILFGSMNWQMSLDEQMVFIKLIAFSARCGKEPGTLCDNDGKPIPNTFLAATCHAPLDVFEDALKKCIDEGRISKNGDNCLLITNWKHYQSEYMRQKKYREKENTDPEKYTDGEYGSLVQR